MAKQSNKAKDHGKAQQPKKAPPADTPVRPKQARRAGRDVRAHHVLALFLERVMVQMNQRVQRVLAGTDDPEAVHNFRVSVRRTRTLLRASRSLYGKRVAGELENRFRVFGDATNSLRDAEVLGDTLARLALNEPLQGRVRIWLGKRTQQQRRLRREACRLLQHDDLAEASDALRAVLLRPPRHDMSLAKFARSQRETLVAGVNVLLPIAPGDVERLHRLRIRFKRMRYTAEMLDDLLRVASVSVLAYRDDDFAGLAKRAARMQKLLGRLHDADVARLAVRRARSLGFSDKEQLSEQLLVKRNELATKSLRKLRRLPIDMVGTKAVVLKTQDNRGSPKTPAT